MDHRGRSTPISMAWAIKEGVKTELALEFHLKQRSKEYREWEDIEEGNEWEK